MTKKKIMILSDLYWTRENIVNEREFNALTSSNLKKLPNEKVKEYYDIVKQEAPDILVLAGDITGDGFSGHGHHYALCSLIKLLVELKITILMISGNHDEEKYYNIVLKYAKTLNNVYDISDRVHDFFGLKFFGIPYAVSESKVSLKDVLNKIKNESIDFLIAHAEIRRRTHLFDSKAKCIITGHFDNKVSFIDNRLFISHGNDWYTTNYSTISMQDNKMLSVKYVFSNYGKESIYYEETLTEIKKGNKIPILLQDDKVIDLLKIENEVDNPFTYYFSYCSKNLKLNAMQKELCRHKELRKLESHKLHKIIFREHGGIKYLRGYNFKKGVESILSAKKTLSYSKQDLLTLTELTISGSMQTNYKFSKEIMKDYLGQSIFNKK